MRVVVKVKLYAIVRVELYRSVCAYIGIKLLASDIKKKYISLIFRQTLSLFYNICC